MRLGAAAAAALETPADAPTTAAVDVARAVGEAGPPVDAEPDAPRAKMREKRVYMVCGGAREGRGEWGGGKKRVLPVQGFSCALSPSPLLRL
jgi:hypothetical protein